MATEKKGKETAQWRARLGKRFRFHDPTITTLIGPPRISFINILVAPKAIKVMVTFNMPR